MDGGLFGCAVALADKSTADEAAVFAFDGEPNLNRQWRLPENKRRRETRKLY